MAIVARKLDAIRGDTNFYVFSHTEEAAAARFTVRTQAGETIVTKSLGSGITAVEDGFEVRLESYETSWLLPARHIFLYDFEITTITGEIVTLYQGTFYVFSDVSY